jgi:hypothetical protein
MNTNETTTEAWATVENPATFEIGSECVCRYCETCEAGQWANEDETCDECGGEFAADFVDCFDCGTTLIDILDELLAEWGKRNGNPDQVRILGRHVGWPPAHGETTTELDAAAVTFAFGFHEFEQRTRFELAGDRLTARRWSHDEPTGAARFDFEPIRDDEECGHHRIDGTGGDQWCQDCGADVGVWDMG